MLNKSLTLITPLFIALLLVASTIGLSATKVFAATPASINAPFDSPYEPVTVKGNGYTATISVGSLETSTPLSTSPVAMPQKSSSAIPMIDNNWFYSVVAMMFLVIAVQGILLFTINRNLAATRRMVRSISVNSTLNTIQKLKRQKKTATRQQEPSQEKTAPNHTITDSARNLNKLISGLCHKDVPHRLECIRELGKIGRSTPAIRPNILTALKAYVVTLLSESALKETTNKEIILAMRVLSGLSDGNSIDFTNQNFIGLHFNGITLQHMDFTGSSFDHCQLNNVQFMGCNFQQTTFSKATLKDVRFAGCDIDINKALKGANHQCTNEDQSTAAPTIQRSSNANLEQYHQSEREKAIAAFKTMGMHGMNLDKSKLH